MIADVAQFVLAATVIIFAGTFLTRAADTIAEQTGWGRLLAGSLFLAAATSLPELGVDVSAIRQSMPNLAVGDLFGSSLFNLLMLAVLDLSHRSHRRMFSRAAAGHALSATMSSTLYIIAAIGILFGQRLRSWSFAGLGIGPAAILVAYLRSLRPHSVHESDARSSRAADERRPRARSPKQAERETAARAASIRTAELPWRQRAPRSTRARVSTSRDGL